MKKLLLIIALMSATFWSQAQTIPNSGFESWESVGGWYFNPENWVTNNCQLMTPVLQDTNSYSGNYSLTISHDYSGITGYAKSRFPYNVHAAAIKVYVKCEISAIDTVVVLVDVYLNRQITGNGIWTSCSSISEWTLITIPITRNSLDGDSLEIQIFGGDSLQTSISLDEFSYDIISGIDAHASPVWNLYPNPAIRQLTIGQLDGWTVGQSAVGGQRSAVRLSIVDLYGREIKEFPNISSFPCILDISDLTNGLYILWIINEEGESGSVKFLKIAE